MFCKSLEVMFGIQVSCFGPLAHKRNVLQQFEPFLAQFIPGRSGAPLIILNEYTYFMQNRQAKGKKIWFCSARKPADCKANVLTFEKDRQDYIFMVRGEHSHDPPEIKHFDNVPAQLMPGRDDRTAMLILEHYVFSMKNHMSNGKKIWYCSSKRRDCRANVITSIGEGGLDYVSVLRGTHDHEPPNIQHYIDVPAQFVPGQSGTPLLILDDFTFYLKNQQQRGKKQWYCSSRTFHKCKVYVITHEKEDVYNDKDEVPEKSESEDEGPPCKKRGRNKPWVYLYKFSNLKEAEDFVNAENTWSRKFTRMTVEGQKRYYRCNKVKKNGPQCAAELYILFAIESDDIFVYRTDADHNHHAIGARDVCGIPEPTKTEINKLFDLHLKPKSILAALEKMDGIKLPSKSQLNNYLSDRRRVKFGNSAINLVPAQSVPGKSGTPLLILDDFTFYLKNQQQRGKKLWYCSSWAFNKCKVYVITHEKEDGKDYILKVQGQHCHEAPILTESGGRLLRKKLKANK